MSASREKKQRQSDPNQGLTQKQIKEQKEAAAQKRSRTIYTLIGVAAVAAVAALLIWDSGFFQSRTTAMTVNGKNYTPGQVSYYYGAARDDYGFILSYMGYDASKPDREQIFNEESGQTYYDLFMEGAKSKMIQNASLADAARAEGVTLSEESRTQVDAALAQYEATAAQYGYPLNAFLKLNFGEYMTKGVLRSCLEEQFLAEQFRQDYSDGLTYDDAALEEYYSEHSEDLDTFEYDVCFISGTPEAKTDEDGNTVEATDEEKTAALEQAKTEADALVDKVEDGEDFEVQANLIVNKIDGSSVTVDNRLTGSGVSSTYKSWLAEAGRKAGDVTVIESENGCYVVRFNSRERVEDDFGEANIRHILVKAETTDADATDASGYPVPSDAAIAAAEEKAKSILAEFEAGDKTAESFAALAAANSADPGSKDNGGLYENVTRSTGFFQAFLNWIFEDGRQVGDTGLVENTQSGQQGWHIMYLDSTGDSLWKYTADSALRSAAVSDWEESLKAGYEAVEGSGARYLG